MRKVLFASALAGASLLSTPVLADPPPWAPAHGWREHHRGEWRDDDDRGDYRPRVYEERLLTLNDDVWRGRDGRYHCHRSDGTTGLIVGGAVGALIGRSLDDGRDRTAGTIVGLAGGALLGRAIDRGELHCR